MVVAPAIGGGVAGGRNGYGLRMVLFRGGHGVHSLLDPPTLIDHLRVQQAALSYSSVLDYHRAGAPLALEGVSARTPTCGWVYWGGEKRKIGQSLRQPCISAIGDAVDNGSG